MIQGIRYKDSDFEMPPKEKLPDAEIAVLEKWVKLGAPWPVSDADKAVVTKGEFSEAQRKFWCFQPLTKPTPPDVKSDWVRGDIDKFIAKKHADLGLTPGARGRSPRARAAALFQSARAAADQGAGGGVREERRSAGL